MSSAACGFTWRTSDETSITMAFCKCSVAKSFMVTRSDSGTPSPSSPPASPDKSSSSTPRIDSHSEKIWDSRPDSSAVFKWCRSGLKIRPTQSSNSIMSSSVLGMAPLPICILMIHLPAKGTQSSIKAAQICGNGKAAFCLSKNKSVSMDMECCRTFWSKCKQKEDCEEFLQIASIV